LEQINYAKEKGLIVIVTDHHEVPFVINNNEKVQILPNADAIINPKRLDSVYPFKEICGAMVALKLADCLISSIPEINPEEYDYLISKWTELAGIGTVCDVMPLVSENRTVVKKALKKIKNGSSYIGIRQLIRVQNIDVQRFNSYNIGFGIGPCINACGRMTGNIDTAIALLLEKDHVNAYKMAEMLKELNEERKKASIEGEKLALNIVDELVKQNRKFYIIYIPNSNPHIMGIIAGRVKENTNHPCICLTDSEHGILKGSGRSIKGYDMFENMSKYKDLYESFGGHELAIGISIKKENLNKFIDVLNQDIESFDDEIFTSMEYIDLFMPASNINEQFVNELSLFEPFGAGNPYPLLVSENVTLTKARRIGKNKEYLSLVFDEKGKNLDSVYFGSADKFDDFIRQNFGSENLDLLYSCNSNIIINILYKPVINVWNGKTSIQIQLKDYNVV